MLRFALVSIVVSAISGCGTEHLKGFLARPEPLPAGASDRIASQTEIPADLLPIARPAAARAFGKRQLIVDVVVVLPEGWGGKADSSAESVRNAAFFTNNLSVPANRRTSGQDGPIVVVRNGAGLDLRTSRVFKDDDAAQRTVEALEKSLRVVAKERAGRKIQFCFVPVLLDIDGPIATGELVDVQIRSERGRQPEWVDGRWYKLRVAPFVDF